MSLSECITILEELYEKDIKIKEGCEDESKRFQVPDKLRDFYSLFQSLKMPFGRIYPIDEGLEMSQDEPFKSEGWFCFGQDDYFSFWLCKNTPDSEGMSFTAWDHEMEEEIGDPAFGSIEEFLLFLSDEYMDSELATMCKVYVSGYCREAMKEMMEVKKAFHSPVSMLDLKDKATKGTCMIKEGFHYYQARKIIRELNIKYLKVTLKKTKEWY